MRTGYIYEYLSPSGKYYIGQTINLMQRLSEHRHFKTKSSLIDRAISCLLYTSDAADEL